MDDYQLVAVPIRDSAGRVLGALAVGWDTSNLLDAAWAALRPGGRIVANAVTLQGEQRLAQAYELHGGELKLESELGKGTTVTIALPATRLIEVRASSLLKEAV